MRDCNLNSCCDFNARHNNKCGRFNDVEVCDKFRDQAQAVCGVASCPCYDEQEVNNCDEMCEPEVDCEDYINKNEIKTETKKMDEFDSALKKAKSGLLTDKVATVKESAVATLNRTKNTAMRVKIGKLAISAIKTALANTPGVPDQVKILLGTEYADIAIGVVVPIIVPSITSSEKAIKLSEDIAIAGGVAIADQLSFIDEFVAMIVKEVGKVAGGGADKKDL